MITPFCDVDVARGVHRHASGLIKPRRAAGAIGRAQAAGRAGQRRHHPVGCNLSDRVICSIRDVDGALLDVHGHASGRPKPRIAAGAIRRARVAGRRAGQRRHHPAGRNLSDRMICPIRNVDVALDIHGHAGGASKPRRTAGAIRRALAAGRTGQRRHHPAGRDLSDRVVTFIRDVDVARGVHGHAVGVVEQRRAAGAIRRAFATGRAGQRRKRGVNVGGRKGYFSDYIIIGVCDIKISCAVANDGMRQPKFCISSLTSITTISNVTATRYGGDDPIRVHFPDSIISRVCYIKVTGRIYRHAHWTIKLRTGGSPSIASEALRILIEVASITGAINRSNNGRNHP